MDDALRITVELAGWSLYTAHVRVVAEADADAVDAMVAAAELEIRESFRTQPLSSHPVVKAVRTRFRRLGTDPTRYRPSFEALARRLLKGEPLPRIHPLVEVINALSLRLRVPVCCVDTARIVPPLALRAGRSGDHFISLRGEFSAHGKPALWDGEGVVGTPIVDAERVKITDASREALLYVYVPHDDATGERVDVPAAEALTELLAASKAGELVAGRWCGAA